jgi:hypothetical protein
MTGTLKVSLKEEFERLVQTADSLLADAEQTSEEARRLVSDSSVEIDDFERRLPIWPGRVIHLWLLKLGFNPWLSNVRIFHDAHVRETKSGIRAAVGNLEWDLYLMHKHLTERHKYWSGQLNEHLRVTEESRTRLNQQIARFNTSVTKARAAAQWLLRKPLTLLNSPQGWTSRLLLIFLDIQDYRAFERKSANKARQFYEKALKEAAPIQRLIPDKYVVQIRLEMIKVNFYLTLRWPHLQAIRVLAQEAQKVSAAIVPLPYPWALDLGEIHYWLFGYSRENEAGEIARARFNYCLHPDCPKELHEIASLRLSHLAEILP